MEITRTHSNVRWNWFLSVNYAGKWIVTDGYADVSQSPSSFEAVLRYAPDADPHAHLEGEIDETGNVKLTVHSFRDGVPSYPLQGQIRAEEIGQEGLVTSVILSNGYTVLGLAHSNKSAQPNLSRSGDLKRQGAKTPS
jgi:hypothetical protein